MTPEAGWYDDGSGRQRWWDGTQWTEHFAPASDISETVANETGGTPSVPQPTIVAPGAPEQSFAAPANAAFASPANSAFAAPGELPAEGASPYAAAPEASGAKKKPSVLAWIALAVAALGFIFACIPGALIVGWVLLPVGFILSIVAFFIKGAKWPAIVGVSLAVVGTIVGFVVFFALLAGAAQDALGGTESSITQPESSDSDETEQVDDAGEEDSAAEGSRENPAPLGSTISGDEYDVVINSVTLDATDEVLSANMFNEEPEAGYSYAIVNVSVTYTGEESGFAAMAMIDYVTSGGEVISAFDSLAVAPEPALGLDELYNGATATGNIAIAIPTGDTGVLRVTPGILADEVFVALQ